MVSPLMGARDLSQATAETITVPKGAFEKALKTWPIYIEEGKGFSFFIVLSSERENQVKKDGRKSGPCVYSPEGKAAYMGAFVESHLNSNSDLTLFEE